MARFSVTPPLALAVSIAACSAGPPGENTVSTATPIQGGTVDTVHDFVVAVLQQGSSQTGLALCSGSLIAPNLVATARHCLAAVTAQPIDCTSTAFGGVAAASTVAVTTDADLSTATHFYAVQKIVVPSGVGESSFCGNDLALLILARSVVLPQYVTPVIDPPMTDHSAYSTTITAIGYGVTSPADTAGKSAGVRRIREGIDLACIPDDKTVADCLSVPGASEYISANEFQATGGTCEGDSGSGAFEQRDFNADRWVSFGVLSRGTTDADSATCTGSIYTRFDAWGGLLASTAMAAATLGGYPTPAWALAVGAEAGPIATESSSPEGGRPDAASCLPTNQPCAFDVDCCSLDCISHDGTIYTCVSCNADNPCNGDDQCDRGTCVPSDAGSNSQSSASASGSADAGEASHPAYAGCQAAGSSERVGGAGLSGFALSLAFAGLLRRGRQPGTWLSEAIARAARKASKWKVRNGKGLG